MLRGRAGCHLGCGSVSSTVRCCGRFASFSPRGKAEEVPRRRSRENEDQPKVKRPCRRPPALKPGSQQWLKWRPLQLEQRLRPSGGMGILLPGQRRFKRRRRVMALEDEMKILDNLEEGVSKGGVGRPLGVSQATTRILKQNEKAIRASIFRHLLQILTASFLTYPMLKTLSLQLLSVVTGSYVSGTYSIVFVNCPNEQIARDIARAILDKKLAASVNILPKASSLYFWNGEIEEATEILLIIKTKTSKVRLLSSYIRLVHPFEIPEIFSLPMDQGDVHYLKWLEEGMEEE